MARIPQKAFATAACAGVKKEKGEWLVTDMVTVKFHQRDLGPLRLPVQKSRTVPLPLPALRLTPQPQVLHL